MSLLQIILEAFQSVTSNKLRSGLTVLGIVIGIAAVIAMVSIGQGAQNSVTSSIEGMGTNLLFVSSGNRSSQVRTIKRLDSGDVTALSDPIQVPSISLVAPILRVNGTASYNGIDTSPSIYGVTPEYLTVRNLELSEGEFITKEHLLGRSSVVVIGVDTAETLFGRSDNLVGESIRIGKQPFRILGVLVSKGGGSFGSQDNILLLPLTTAQSRLAGNRKNQYDQIYLQAVSAEKISQAKEEIRLVLSERHRTAAGEEDFTITTQEDFLETATTITGVFTIFLGGVAGISLLVGGIGIMNIMLVSVTERTREIGLRKALGAKRRDILIQFITESSVLSLIGGVIGILLGWALSWLIGKIAAASGTAITPSFGLDTVLLATAFSTAVGVFFGIYPANRAAKLQPVEALRSE